MKTIKICIGSACHLKGSYQVIEAFKQMIEENALQGEIELSAAFCLGRCTEAVSVERWDGEILSISKENAREQFKTQIMTYL